MNSNEPYTNNAGDRVVKLGNHEIKVCPGNCPDCPCKKVGSRTKRVLNKLLSYLPIRK